MHKKCLKIIKKIWMKSQFEADYDKRNQNFRVDTLQLFWNLSLKLCWHIFSTLFNNTFRIIAMCLKGTNLWKIFPVLFYNCWAAICTKYCLENDKIWMKSNLRQRQNKNIFLLMHCDYFENVVEICFLTHFNNIFIIIAMCLGGNEVMKDFFQKLSTFTHCKH